MAIANVAALKKVVVQHESAALVDVVKAISIKLRLADQNDNDSANHRREAGEMLVTLRARVEADNQSWKQFVYDYFDRPRKELEKLMTYVPAHKVARAAIAAHPQKSDRAIAEEIGVDHKTVAKARARTGDHSPVEKRIGKDGKARKMPEPKQRTLREIAREKQLPIVLLTEAPCDGCNSKQEFWQNSLSSMAGDAISLSAYWTQQFGNWQQFEPTAEMVVLATQAAETWNEIVETMIKSPPRAIPEPTAKATPQAIEPRKLPKPPKIDMNVIKQAGAFHTELLKYTLEFCERIKSWHAEHPVDEESHFCVVQALETASMRLQLMAQEIDDR